MTEDLVHLQSLGPALARVLGDDRWRDVSAELISGGKSNLTFFIRSEAGELVLRRPPTGKLLPKAHDMGREARVQEALATTSVPVAKVVLTDDGDLLGVPCYVMERVNGYVIRDELPGLYRDRSTFPALAHGFVDTLAAIHAVVPDSVGLGDYGQPEGFLERQVRRWIGQWEKSLTHEVPAMTELGARLVQQVPAQQRSTVVHGDFRLDNLVMHPTIPGEVSAVLDWELSTLGDPLTDVALLMLFWRGPSDPELSLIPGVSHLPGMPTRDDLLARYGAATGTDLNDMDFYQAFAHFKFAAVAQGVQFRGRAGVAAGQDFGDLDDEIAGLAARGLDYL